jgi:hypothetical protein
MPEIISKNFHFVFVDELAGRTATSMSRSPMYFDCSTNEIRYSEFGIPVRDDIMLFASKILSDLPLGSLKEISLPHPDFASTIGNMYVLSFSLLTK